FSNYRHCCPVGTDLGGEVGYMSGILIVEKGWTDEENTSGWHSVAHAHFGFGDGGGHEARAGSGLHQGAADDGAAVYLDRMLCRRQWRRPLGKERLDERYRLRGEQRRYQRRARRRPDWLQLPGRHVGVRHPGRL